jgi:hypothetical protein
MYPMQGSALDTAHQHTFVFGMGTLRMRMHAREGTCDYSLMHMTFGCKGLKLVPSLTKYKMNERDTLILQPAHLVRRSNDTRNG